MNGVLVWKTPHAASLVKYADGTPLNNQAQKNAVCKVLMSNELLEVNQVVILLSDTSYYVMKNKITGVLGVGQANLLPKFIDELEAVSE